MPDVEPTVYSYHTFIFPFIFHSDKGMEGFEACLDNNENAWESEKWDDGKARIKDEKHAHVFYNQWQYFHDSARNAIYGIDGRVSQNYVYRNATGKHYVIRKGKTTWSLRINAIRLKLFNTNVGFLIFELENDNHPSMNDVMKINEYGRRVCFPYLYSTKHEGHETYGCSLTASSLTLEGLQCPPCDYENFLNEWKQPNQKPNIRFVSPIITGLLGTRVSFENASYWTEKQSKAGHSGCIACEAVSDDRMYVCCLVYDPNRNFLRQVAAWNPKTKQYAWEEEALEKAYHDKTMSKLYEFIFVDGDGATCIGRNKRLQLIKDHLDTRWMEYIPKEELDGGTEYGTFFAATDHSMVSVANWDGEIIPFLTQRVQIALLVLAQRTSIISLARKAGKASTGFNADGRVTRREIREISKLQERYVAFQNQLMFLEVTAQEQGIDNYQLLRKSLHIDEEIDQLERQLHNLYEITNTNATHKLNLWLIVLAVVGVVTNLDGIKDFIQFLKQILVVIIEFIKSLV